MRSKSSKSVRGCLEGHSIRWRSTQSILVTPAAHTTTNTTTTKMIVGRENRRYLQSCGQIERLWTLSGTGIGVIKFALTSIHCGSFIMKGQVGTQQANASTDQDIAEIMPAVNDSL